MKTFYKTLFLTLVVIAGLLIGAFTNLSTSHQTSVAEAATPTPTVVTIESDEPTKCFNISDCDSATDETLFEADAYEALSKLPVHPLVASGNVGYRYISSTIEADPKVQAPYFYVYSANEPGLKHLMKAEVHYKA